MKTRIKEFKEFWNPHNNPLTLLGRILVNKSSNAGKMKTIGYHQALSDIINKLRG